MSHLSIKFHQNQLVTFGDILFTRNDYTHTQQHQQQYIIGRAPAGSAADKDSLMQ